MAVVANGAAAIADVAFLRKVRRETESGCFLAEDAIIFSLEFHDGGNRAETDHHDDVVRFFNTIKPRCRAPHGRARPLIDSVVPGDDRSIAHDQCPANAAMLPEDRECAHRSQRCCN